MSLIKNIYRLTMLLLLAVTALFSSSCNKLLNAPVPNNQLNSSSVFLDSLTAQSALAGMYSLLYNGGLGGSGYYSYYITLDPAKAADEVYAASSTVDNFSSNSLLSGNTNVAALWNDSYKIIYTANSLMQGAQASDALTTTQKQQLIAQAKFVRAFCYFYLVNYFGDVPLELTTVVATNSAMPRTASAKVYAQIITDLTDARDALGADYSWSQGDRTRANTWAASALLSRVYLYTGQWASAETEATRVIGNTGLYGLLPDLNSVFLKNSNESILSFYTNYNGFPYLNSSLNQPPYYNMRPEQKAAFEPGDNRATSWVHDTTIAGITYTYPYKYKSFSNTATEFQVCLRLGEQYLIRSEARMQQNNIGAAQSDLNTIRSRAGLGNTTAADTASFKLALEHERQVELFYEWGDRWLNLKRTNRADVVLRAEKPDGWQATDQLYPIPLAAVTTNPALTQNPGY